MSQDHLELRESPIAGRGVFAARPIKAGEVIFTAHPDDIIYEIDAVYAMPPDQRDYILHYTWQNGPTTLCLDGGIGRYQNHSCDPNTWWISEDTTVARRDIAAGEEITCDYGAFMMTVPYDMPCNCGAANCRGRITHRDYLDPRFQLTHGDHVPPYIRAAIEAAKQALHGDLAADLA